uniref:Enhancer of rudimentary homolog n=6 Tax=Timema TaxID=61471 RepID=A0A7R9E8R0_9NEOP|nr:unnamed protein product [Timema monikensis]
MIDFLQEPTITSLSIDSNVNDPSYYCLEGERERKTTLNTPDRNSSPDLPVIGSLVSFKSDALNHAATQAGYEKDFCDHLLVTVEAKLVLSGGSRMYPVRSFSAFSTTARPERLRPQNLSLVTEDKGTGSPNASNSSEPPPRPSGMCREFGDMDPMSHTIMLIQSGNKPETRTYSDYESVNECMEGVCKIYEEHLKQQNPNTPSITYDISQLFDFIDQVADLSCLVYQKSTNTYAPYNKDWIKEKIYVLLRRQARSQKTTISRHDQDSNPDLPVIIRPVKHESEALDHLVNEAGLVVALYCGGVQSRHIAPQSHTTPEYNGAMSQSHTTLEYNGAMSQSHNHPGV